MSEKVPTVVPQQVPSEEARIELKPEDIARLMQEAELLRNLAQSLQRQVTLLSASIRELEQTREVLDTISKTSEGTEVLVPIGGRVYVRATLKCNSRALVELGANYVMEAEIDKVKEILENRQRELEKALQLAQSNLQQVLTRLAQIQAILDRIREAVERQQERKSE